MIKFLNFAFSNLLIDLHICLLDYLLINSMDGNKSIHVVIKDKNGLILEDDVTAVSSYNDKGIFDVLPLHTNFITLIREKITIHKKAETKDIMLRVGLMKVDANNINIYLGLPEPLEPETEVKQ